ncbi:MAG TPA: acetate uptake transporter [Chloroflexota bacterium]|nr:acetate uptake transporter [Chloroflexota bacterium]
MATVLERWTPAGPIRSQLPPEAIAQEEARAAASVGEPAPLGLFAFAAATFTLSAVNAGWFSATNALFAMVPLIIFGGLVQLLAGMWAYRKGDTFAATAFGSFGGFNAAYGLYVLLKQAGLIAGSAGIAGGGGVVGVFLICLGAIAAMLAVAALWRGMVLVGVLVALAVTYVLLGIYLISTGTLVLMHIGGYAGLISSFLAFYAGGAMVINSVSSRAVLPLGGSLSPDSGTSAPVAMPLRVNS